MSNWGDIARARIEAVAATIPKDATLAQRTAAIDAAYPFGVRSHWPYRAWCKARRSYLVRYGYDPRASKGKLDLLDLMERDPVTGRPLIK